MKPVPFILSQLMLLLFFTPPASAQHSFLSSTDAYFGQPQPGDTPRVFAPPHLTDSGYFILGRVAFSSDGKEFYFGSNDSWFNNAHQALRWTRFENGHWQPSRLLVDKGGQPTFAMDDQTLYLSNTGVIQALRRWIPAGQHRKSI
jgi:hypothetical protein